MRIIAGEFGGRTLRTVRDFTIRPTTDRAKQVIFDVLATRVAMEESRTLDLFAGSGSLGLEALSRGVPSVVFVEQAPKSLDALHTNIRTLGVEKRVKVVRGDVFRYLASPGRSFDLVFADPPYKLGTIGSLADVIGRSGALRPGGWLVMEHSTETPVEPDATLFTVLRKQLGQTMVLILQKRDG
ncbi:MAG: 16S rRNA (guanine(966)-N(2))-methyltransferase RsmD [Ignavibacteria bacterium GWA2_55_11]|nr:MAG: 16S rRNA (guanine(966)-N(2))-methyltransferase RsmD [Ignavibacteria bacterium GWA2_55_11]OGU64900.1 MAG: 16S rRNA (guanine(966)-N(2))-methyltransferase RsmD [Ignavibacteria bacterium RIFCSPHIGHO2_02_FULL_56_12]OGU70435.1 MAG: 16S rRNA (guanine(966)-N(2))-methyltransferase RsmD [Ignavibacteria bacterium RIFCSPLOWO2_02_FULL_55_14]OGU72564.1 MAG: 16S rRNA (guanine(966)-N(2))-methyltransferase RsmD [Ignavibacteria bacterium RIFCSPLOWO2_12_FULL_56_21]